MHPTPSLVNGSVEEAVEALASRMVALRHGAPRMTKEAMAGSDILGQLGQYWQGLDPAAQKAMLGAAAGGAVGLGANLFGKKEKKRPLSSILTGALAGGAIGGGVGLAQKYRPKPTGLDASGRPILPKGQFYHPRTGETMRIKDPAGISPEQVKELERLQAAGERSPYDIAAEKGVKTLWDQGVYQNPATAIGGAGLAISDKLRGRTGIRPGLSQNIGHMEGGMKALSAMSPEAAATLGISSQHREALAHLASQGRLGEAARHVGDLTVKDVPFEQMIKRQQLNPHGMGLVDKAGKPLMEEVKQVGKRPAVVVPAAVLETLKSLGASAELPEVLYGKKGIERAVLRKSLGHDVESAIRRFLRRSGDNVFFRNPHVNVRSWGGRLRGYGKWGALLGGGVAVERYLRSLWRESSARKQLEDRIKELAEPVAAGGP